MARTHYTKSLKLQVAKEAARPENRGLEYFIAEKYNIKPWTVIKWRDHFLEVGEADAFKEGYSKGTRKSNRELELEKENAALREEVEILKKAAVFLANVKRD